MATKKQLKTPSQKYSDLSKQIRLVEKHLEYLQSTVNAKGTIQYSKVQSMNLDLTKLLARAGNLCWE